jgi:hypothetical protein
MCRAAHGRLRPYPTSAERGPQTASWRGLRAQEFSGNAGSGAMGVIIPFVWTVARVFLDGQSAASRCYLQTAKGVKEGRTSG